MVRVRPLTHGSLLQLARPQAKVVNCDRKGLSWTQMDTRNRATMYSNMKLLNTPVRNADVTWYLDCDAVTLSSGSNDLIPPQVIPQVACKPTAAVPAAAVVVTPPAAAPACKQEIPLGPSAAAPPAGGGPTPADGGLTPPVSVASVAASCASAPPTPSQMEALDEEIARLEHPAVVVPEDAFPASPSTPPTEPHCDDTAASAASAPARPA